MGSILSPINYLFELIFKPYNPRNRVCSTVSNYYNDSVFGSYFVVVSPIPIVEELSIEDLCFEHDMKKEEIVMS
jgi:hypothetical protein